MHQSRKLRIVASALAAALLAGSWGCKKEESAQEESLPPVSAFSMSSPHTKDQLLSGFWGVENHAWRWTKHSFSVSLVPPPGAAQRGAQIEFRFALPDVVTSRRGSVTLSVSVNDVALPPETYNTPGNYVYKADVPAAALQAAGPATVAFKTDKFLAAGEVESRELALIAQNVGLTPR